MSEVSGKSVQTTRGDPPAATRPALACPGRSSSSAAVFAAIAVSVCAIVYAVHRPVLTAQAYCFDDKMYLTDNALVRNPGWNSAARLMKEILKPSTVGGYSHPLTMISLMLDYALGGRPEDLRQFHRTSLWLHVMNTALVMGLVYLLFEQPWAAGMAGLLFGLHPLTVEPIAWLSQRKTVLAATFALGSLTLYVLYAGKPRRAFYGGSLVAYAASLLSKPSALPLPVLMLLLDYWPMRALSKRRLVQKIPFFIVGGVSIVVTAISQARTMGVRLPGSGNPTRSPAAVCYKVMFYLGKIVWPAHLSPYYEAPDPLTVFNPVVLAGVIVTPLLIVALLVSWRWTRCLLVGGLFFLVSLLPVLGLVGFSWTFAFDNYLYLPMVGLLLSVGYILTRCWNPASIQARPIYWRRMTVAAAATLTIAEAIAVRRVLAHWQTTEGLMRYMLVLSPEAAPLHNILGGLLVMEGRMNDGIRHLNRSLQLDPSSSVTHENIAAALARQGHTDQAIAHYNEVLRLGPAAPRTHYNLGNALLKQGKLQDALEHYRQAVQLRPDFVEAENNLGSVLVRLGRTDEAIEHFTHAVRLRPDFINARKNLASALARQGKLDEAVGQYRQVLRLQPEDAEALRALEALLKRH
jgi:tetratricopeptide (TPR) repeat protein